MCYGLISFTFYHPAQDSVEAIGGSCGTVLSMLPNDAVVADVSSRLLAAAKAADPNRRLLHISCSTISPTAARALAKKYAEAGSSFVSSPVFARPDGIQRKQAVWMQAGEAEGRKEAARLLGSSGRVVDFGDDAGASNVVKLCGNFLIAVSYTHLNYTL
jgi:3-hydroxyisobutyrate dehydrogenase-like beta-hydroxyacid dehydrogenase